MSIVCGKRLLKSWGLFVYFYWVIAHLQFASRKMHTDFSDQDKPKSRDGRFLYCLNTNANVLSIPCGFLRGVVVLNINVILSRRAWNSICLLKCCTLWFFSKCAQGLVHLELGRLRAGSWLSSRKTSQNSQVSDKFICIKWGCEGQGTGTVHRRAREAQSFHRHLLLRIWNKIFYRNNFLYWTAK